MEIVDYVITLFWVVLISQYDTAMLSLTNDLICSGLAGNSRSRLRNDENIPKNLYFLEIFEIPWPGLITVPP